MKSMIDLKVIIDEKYEDPLITIYTKTKDDRIENIITAIENSAESGYSPITAYEDDKIVLLSQRDIIRVYTSGRKIAVRTDTNTYYVNKSLSELEQLLNSKRFIRISQSEIINIYKVKGFEFSTVGTVGIEFDNGEKTWSSRSRVKSIKDMLKNLE